LLAFIKEAISYEIAIISSEVINKAIEIVPDFKENSYNSIPNWFKQFREKNSFSIRKANKLSQSLTKNYMKNIHKYIYNAVKDIMEKEIYFNSNIVANINETPIVLEPITGFTIEKKGQKTIIIHIFGKSKERISCILRVIWKLDESTTYACI